MEQLNQSSDEMNPEKPATMVASTQSRILGLLEEQPVLETAQRKVSELVQPLIDWLDDLGIKDVLHGRQIGHALHPIAVDLPIGFWTSAFVLDVVGARKSARFLTGMGCASAVLAAASGTTDWSATDGRERRLGFLHGTLNLAGTACQVVALTSRRHYSGWSWTGSAITTVAAYLGGELVFGRGIMVDHDAWTAGPAKWTPTCRLAEIPDGGVTGVEVEGRRVLLHREGTRVSAMENACSHLGGPLDEGKVANGVVTCPWHGSQFRLTDGRCVRGPATFSQLRLEARVVDGAVQVRGRTG
ncbi:MAG TPA: Rieske 2Fe-2S domain-containing protein [Candidatus Dormibacteraeota bacterium]|nr:Rieske 2Fe-2S domain-containing protein [Candidatus Dormibacteraeota bacterium]